MRLPSDLTDPDMETLPFDPNFHFGEFGISLLDCRFKSIDTLAWDFGTKRVGSTRPRLHWIRWSCRPDDSSKYTTWKKHGVLEMSYMI